MENELANMNVETEVVAPEAITGTKPPEAEVSGEEAEVHVDEAPDPAALQAEIDRLNEVKKKAEEDARYWRKEKAQARADYFRGTKGEEKKEPPPIDDVGIGPAPRMEDFDDFNKYNDSKIQYEVTKARITWDRDQARKQVEQTRQAKLETLNLKIAKGFEKYADFEEVAMDQTVPITPVIMDVLSDSDIPEDVAYYLGKNRAEAIQIARMTPTQAARAIAKIEVELVKNINTKPLSAKKVSNAPPPINPLNTGGAAVDKDPDKMNQKEYEEWRKGHGARRY